jgi:hypothetical protein
VKIDFIPLRALMAAGAFVASTMAASAVDASNASSVTRVALPVSTPNRDLGPGKPAASRANPKTQPMIEPRTAMLFTPGSCRTDVTKRRIPSSNRRR